MDKTESSGRIAIINAKNCKPNKCNLQCAVKCPVNVQNKICIDVKKTSQTSKINESMCIGCGICVKVCPYKAIKIINLPKNIPNECTHRYGENRFILFKLPVPKLNSVLGIVGTNGIGKTTALQILTRKIIPNFGKFRETNTWDDVIQNYKGSELQSFFKKSRDNELKTSFKMQFVDQIPKIINGKVIDFINKKDNRKIGTILTKLLDLENVLEREIKVLSGGELQRFALLICLLQDSEIFVFDEPSSYLDVKQRLTVADCIRGLVDKGGESLYKKLKQFSKEKIDKIEELNKHLKLKNKDDEKYTHSVINADSVITSPFNTKKDKYIIVVEHDLSLLDYLSDHICCLFGKAASFGVVSFPYSCKEGLNIFLEGFLPKENVKFRDEGLVFNIKEQLDSNQDNEIKTFQYPDMVKKQTNGFELNIEGGSFTTSNIIVLLGENGTGKTTLVKILSGIDKTMKEQIPEMLVSYKPQTISPKFEGTVKELLIARINYIWEKNEFFKFYVFKQLGVEKLFSNKVKQLSGGELQRVGLMVCLGKPADVYLIDEPSAYLDCEQRIIIAKSIKRFILTMKKTAFIVEHDFIMATYLADKVIVYEGIPGKKCKANKPCSLTEGMNKFLSILGISFRRDPNNLRPRINKLDSQMDQEQKLSGNYFLNDK